MIGRGPAGRIEILRNAFDLTMKDPGFLEDAAKAGMDIKPISGIEIQLLVKAIVQSAPEEALKLTQWAPPKTRKPLLSLRQPRLSKWWARQGSNL